MLTITIPTPCHEDWNKMTPDATGRHCSVCIKSVVDFTNMSDDEVKNFFLNKKEDEKVCGRFKQTQLHNIVIELPQNIFGMKMPLWKKFLAACLIVFSTTLFSCDTKISDKGHENTELTYITAGLIEMRPDTLPMPPPPNTTVGVTFCAPEVLQGDIMIEEPIPVSPVDRLVIVPVKDTAYESFIGKALIINDPLTPAKTKNPPAADPINCNTIKNYY